MKKSLILSLSLLISCLAFNSCDPWEDDSYHEGGPGGGGMLLKEVHTTYPDGSEGLATYTYDNQSRMKEVYVYANILDMETYSHTVNTYASNTNYTSVSNTYTGGVVQMTNTINALISGNTANITIQTEYEVDGETISINATNQLTFSAPCGTSENVMTIEMPEMPTQQTTITYEYTDANCSHKEFQDGELTSTVTNDDKYSPYNTPEAYAMGIVGHNYIKAESTDGTVETVTYTYNENDYPTQAVHSFSEGSGQTGYTETFTYY